MKQGSGVLMIDACSLVFAGSVQGAFMATSFLPSLFSYLRLLRTHRSLQPTTINAVLEIEGCYRDGIASRMRHKIETCANKLYAQIDVSFSEMMMTSMAVSASQGFAQRVRDYYC